MQHRSGFTWMALLFLSVSMLASSFGEEAHARNQYRRHGKSSKKALRMVTRTTQAKNETRRPAAVKRSTPTAVLVDKKTKTLRVTEYRNGVFETLKTFHSTVGKVLGDKQDEGDLKTPEGIYIMKSCLKPPSIKPKFGVMAFYLDYPNAYDRIAGRTGKDIMLHATDTPDRLKNDYDSEGCVVVNNDEIKQIEPYVKTGLTPVLIFEDLKEEYMKPGQDPKLTDFFKSWVNTWENESIDAYIDHYHSEFSAQGKGKSAWKNYKLGLNQRYAKIEVKVEDPIFYKHPKYSVITFTQNYHSLLKGGGTGHKSRGTKILYVAEEDGKLKIISETYTPRLW